MYAKQIPNFLPMISTYTHFNLLKKVLFFHRVLNTYYEVMERLKTVEKNSHQFQLKNPIIKQIYTKASLIQRVACSLLNAIKSKLDLHLL